LNVDINVAMLRPYAVEEGEATADEVDAGEWEPVWAGGGSCAGIVDIPPNKLE
jgi:hypothetical protein